MAYISYNPWLGCEVRSFPYMTPEEIGTILDQSARAFASWREKPLAERCGMMNEFAALVTERRNEFALLMATEMGKPVAQGLAEADKCSLICRWYATEAPAILESQLRPSGAGRSKVKYDSQGIILGVMPWNFPFWQVFRFLVPVLTGGNAALLKHASNVPQCALAIEKAVADAGFPPGLFRNVFAGHQMTERIISSPSVRGVSLTGSNLAGAAVAAVAGRHMKKIVMELGGSDPFIVLDDASLEEAAAQGIASRFQNCGQSCIAAKRFFVNESVSGEFTRILLERAEKLRVGDPLDPSTDVGPMVSPAAADELQRQLEASLRMGAKLLCGGRDISSGKSVFRPAIVTDVPLSSPLATEETFGPVLPLFTFRTDEEAVAAANNTPFGLGAAVWSHDVERALRMADRLDTGTVAINGFVRSDPALPFGGVKDSGVGRELGREGLLEFMNVKTVTVF